MFAGGRARKETIKKPSNSFCHIRKHYFWWGNKGWGMIILYTKLVTITTQAKKKKKSAKQTPAQVQVRRMQGERKG